MSKYLKKFDMISPNNILYFNNNPSHQSSFSGLLSLLCYSLIFFFFIYFSIDVIKKKNPTSYFYKQFIEEVGTYYLNTSTIFHCIQLLDEDNNLRIDDNSFIMFGTEEYIDRFLLNFSLEETDHYYYGKCIKNDILNNESIINEENIFNSYCIRGFWNATLKENTPTSHNNFIYPYLKYGSNSKKHKNIGYGIYIIKCQNISYRKNKCKIRNEIEEEYNKLLRIKFTLIDNNFDITIYKKPVVPYLLEVTNHLTGNTITLNNLNFVPVNIKSDDGYVFSNDYIVDSFRFDLNEKLSYNKNNDNSVISAFYFIMGNKVEIYMRTYKKFQDALANIGGVSKALLMFAFVLNFLINDYVIEKDINKHYFAILKDNKKNNNLINVNHIQKDNDKNDEESENNKSKKKDIHKSLNWEKSSDIVINDRNSTINKKSLFNNFVVIPTNRNSIFHNIENQKQKIIENKIKEDFNFKIYCKSIFIKNSFWSKRLHLIREIWKNKISEENILFLSIEVESINKNIKNYSQFSFVHNFSHIKKIQ